MALKTDKEFLEQGYTYLGFANAGNVIIPQKCIEERHIESHESRHPRGHDNVSYCTICKWYYTSDSSD